jgi:hypothetical protein
MKLVLNKSFFYQLFFAFCVVIPFFNSYELSFLCWGIAIILTLKKRFSTLFSVHLLLYILILVIAILTSFFFKYKTYFIVRDITYLLKPIMGLLLGYQFYKERLVINPLAFLMKAGIIMAVVHLVLVGYGVVFQGSRSVADIRYYGGYLNDYEIYTFIILLFHKKFGIDLPKKRYYLYLLIFLLSSFFYLARTNFIQFFILFFAVKGWLILNKKTIVIFASLFTISILSYAAIYQYNPKRSGSTTDEFLYKIKLIPFEAFSTKINRNDWRDFHDHYRSYENVRTIEQLSFNNTLLFGEGIGSQVDLKIKVHLNDMFLRRISILHNGFMTILLKSGVIGLFLLILSILFFFKKFKAYNELDKNINYLFLGTGVFLLLSYWVFMGFYYALDAKSLLIGFLFAVKHKLAQDNK